MALREQLKVLKQKAKLLVMSERKLFSQKAGIKHLFLSDKNTVFFHSMVKTNNSRNTISFLCREDSSIMDDQDEIIESFVNFYKWLFWTAKDAQPARSEVLENGLRLNEEDREGLVRDVTIQEIKDALFNIDEGKALGLDGFSTAFFKKNWTIIGETPLKRSKNFSIRVSFSRAPIRPSLPSSLRRTTIPKWGTFD
ncbi:uncharacterized protein LOC121752809 [Salvia splendens]|uniref:uncharacterized protein LOC121752809 n=1 Tax=Salvia splendens TaxID=180675 RepID=UPI001C27963E|nr:uncharacterized protein LOC121752809 [Salvia splendens]